MKYFLCCLLSVLPLSALANDNCPSVSNLLVNCGFDSDISGDWIVIDGTGMWQAADGATAAGSLEVDAVDDGSSYIIRVGYCVNTFAAATTYGGGFSYKLVSGTPTVDYIELTQRPQSNCGGVPSATDYETNPGLFSSWWDPPNLSITTTDSAGGVSVFLSLSSDSPFSIRVDDGYLGEGLVPVELQSFDVN